MTMTREQVAALLDGTTPGPWKTRKGFMAAEVEVAPCKVNGKSAPRMGQWAEIATVDADYGKRGQGNKNARLMAAAPALARQLLAAMDRLADADMAQAALVERAAEAADCGCKADKSDCLFMSGDVTFCYREGLPDIRALAPDAGVKDLAALRAERDDLRARVRWNIDENGNYIRVCRGDHDKGEDCSQHEEVFVPQADRDRLAAELAEARKQVEALREAEEQWRDVVSWLDNGEKTFFAWCAGGGDPDGEFSKIGLRRETPDGKELFRDYAATGPWKPSALAAEEPKP